MKTTITFILFGFIPMLTYAQDENLADLSINTPQNIVELIPYEPPIDYSLPIKKISAIGYPNYRSKYYDRNKNIFCETDAYQTDDPDYVIYSLKFSEEFILKNFDKDSMILIIPDSLHFYQYLPLAHTEEDFILSELRGSFKNLDGKPIDLDNPQTISGKKAKKTGKRKVTLYDSVIGRAAVLHYDKLNRLVSYAYEDKDSYILSFSDSIVFNSKDQLTKRVLNVVHNIEYMSEGDPETYDVISNYSYDKKGRLISMNELVWTFNKEDSEEYVNEVTYAGNEALVVKQKDGEIFEKQKVIYEGKNIVKIERTVLQQDLETLEKYEYVTHYNYSYDSYGNPKTITKTEFEDGEIFRIDESEFFIEYYKK
ncbi:MAG: hypothetical protein HRT68_11665 [Flavobacteriaceae bacterium]|nr:hypothetical protein [Flavobacteriaceae bacterium]